MENCEGGAISDIMLAIGSPLNEDQAKEVMAYTLLALEHCHKNGIIHRVLFLMHVCSDTCISCSFVFPFVNNRILRLLTYSWMKMAARNWLILGWVLNLKERSRSGQL